MIRAAKTASPSARMTARPMRKAGVTMKMKPLRMWKAKMVRTLTPKALKNPAAILESQALRVATVPWKPMAKFRSMWSHQQKIPKEMHQPRGTRQMTQNLHTHPHGLMPTTRTLKRSRNVSVARMPSFWIRTSAHGMLA